MISASWVSFILTRAAGHLFASPNCSIVALAASADVDSDAKIAAVGNVEGTFDTDFASYRDLLTNAIGAEPVAKPAISCTVEQSRTMLAEVERGEQYRNMPS